jgi:hypothetical protein
MASQIQQTLAKPAAPQARPTPPQSRSGATEGSDARAQSTNTQSTRQTRDPAPVQGQEPRRPAPAQAERRGDRVEVQGRDPREQGRVVQSRGEAVTRLQSAGQKVDAGRQDLQRLGQIAQQSANGGDEVDRASLDEEAQEIGGRLSETDRDPDVQNARETLRQASLERDASQARTEATRLDRQAEAAARPPERRPPTLVLEARQPDDEQAQQRAEQADREAQEAERAATEERRNAQLQGERPTQGRGRPEDSGRPENSGRPERGGRGERGGPSERPEDRSNTSIRPERVDVSSPEAARETGRSVTEAQGRADRFRADIRQAETDEGRRAEAAAQDASSSTGARRLTSETEGRQTADRIRQSAQSDPRRFVDAQARVNSDAAARLLA